jgi:hypothetical protein
VSQGTPVSKVSGFQSGVPFAYNQVRRTVVRFRKYHWIMKQKNHPQWCLGRYRNSVEMENRNSSSTNAKLQPWQQLVNSDDLCICLEEKIQKQFKFRIPKLLVMEQTKAYKDYGNSLLTKPGL